MLFFSFFFHFPMFWAYGKGCPFEQPFCFILFGQSIAFVSVMSLLRYDNFLRYGAFLGRDDEEIHAITLAFHVIFHAV